MRVVVSVVAMVSVVGLFACNAMTGVDDLNQVACDGTCGYAAPTQASEYEPPTTSSSTSSSSSGIAVAPKDGGAADAARGPTISRLTLNAVEQASIEVNTSTAVRVGFQLSDATATCKLNDVAITGTSTEIPGRTDVGSTTFTLACTNADGTSRATFTVNVRDLGRWFQANEQNCPTFCAGLGKSNVQSPSGFRCASGERQPPWPTDQVAFGDFTYPFGVWPSRVAQNTVFTSDTSSDRKECYAAGQNHDGDNTDKTVACFCKGP